MGLEVVARIRVFHMKVLGRCVEEKILEAWERSPKGERAKEESKRLAAKWSWMRAETIIWACTCFSCDMVVHLSARSARGGPGEGICCFCGGATIDDEVLVLSSHEAVVVVEWVVLRCLWKDCSFGGNI